MTRSFLTLPALSLLALTACGSAAAERAVPIPAAAATTPAADQPATAVLAGGCFWGMEAVFNHVKGVRAVTAGYAGGTKATASYDQVSTETTGHAEAIRVSYDPKQVSYATLLRVYFSVAHDPTQVDGQRPDSGPSYRSAIFPQNAAQAKVAAAYIRQLNATHAYPRAIATKIENGSFYPAETYHQDFARKNPSHPYIVRWDKPKVAAFHSGFPALWR